MRIGPPVITHRQGRHLLSANIAVETNGIDCPESFWFATDGGESFFLPDLADAFVIGLVASAMRLGEDIWVEGKVSTRLAHGLETYQNVLNTWWPDSFKCVDIHYECLVDRRKDLRPAGVGCSFSGGLDSYHAVQQLKALHTKYSGFGITHALMINGFDQLVDLDHKGIAPKMHSYYQSILKEWDVNLLMIDTNIQSFRRDILGRRNQVHSYSGPLAACAHALNGLFGRFGISGHASYAYNDLVPEGSHVALDHHLSSDHLQIIHTGANQSRARKTEMMADSPQVQKGLRVCFNAPDFDQHTGLPINCCECEKCVRTMVSLMIIGKLDKFPTFANRRPPLIAYQNPKILCATTHLHLRDMTDLARRHGQGDWVKALDAARRIRRTLESRAKTT